MSRNVYQVRVAGPRGPGLTTAQEALVQGALDAGEAAEAALETASAASRIAIPRVLAEGDSIMASNFALTFGTNFGMTQGIGELTWARAMFPYFEFEQWPDASDTTNYSSGMNIAVAGSTTASVLTRLEQGALLAPDIVCLAVGVNDINAGTAEATILANIQTAARWYSGLGCKVLLGTVRPVAASYHADWSDGGSRTLKRISLNASLAAWAATEPNVHLVNLDEGIGDGGSPVRPASGTTSDGLHLTRLGGFLGGQVWLSALRKVIKPLVIDRPSGPNLITGGLFTGTTGTAGTSTTGDVGDDWKVDGVSGGGATLPAAIAASKDADDDFQVLEITPGGGSAEWVAITREIGGVTLEEGKWYKGLARVKLLASDYWRGFTFTPWNGTTGSSAMGPSAILTDTLPLAEDTEFLVETPAFVGPSGGTTGAIILRLMIDGASPDPLTAHLLEVHIAEVPDPRPLHGL
jgi:lysophospholipase L1-like esterase